MCLWRRQQVQKLAAQQLQEERENLVAGWEREMREERAQQEQVMHSAHALQRHRLLQTLTGLGFPAQALEKDREILNYKLKEEREGMDRRIQEEWASKRALEDGSRAAKAHELALLEREVLSMNEQLQQLR